MKNYIKIILLIIFSFSIFTACSKNVDIEQKQIEIQDKQLKIGKIGNGSPIERAIVARMLALANNTKNEIMNLERQINFKDTNTQNWYDKYINAVYIKGDMNGVFEDKFMPNDNLTLIQTQYLIDKYDTSKKVKIKIDDTNKDKPISYALWCDIYSKMMLNKNIKEETFTVLATENTNSDLKDGYAMTDKGIYYFEGMNIQQYLNTKIKVLVNGIDIIAITEVLELEPILTRCYIENIKNNETTIFVGGARKILKNSDIQISEANVGKIADIKISQNKILDIEYYENEINGEIKRVNQNSININNVNYILDENFKLYSKIGKEIKYKQLNDLYPGQNVYKFYSKGNENKIYAGIIDGNYNFEKIRVLINNSDFKSNLFNELEIYSEGGFKVYVKNQTKEYKSTDTLIMKKEADFSLAQNEIIRLELTDNSKGFKIKGLKRAYSEPVYFGNIEIIKENDKYILINEIEFEKYMESVLSSNNGNYENIEMLKTMAIINRSISLSNIKENRFKDMGANVDDSSKSIIYNNLPVNENIKKAIAETKGKFLHYNQEIIKPNYFGYSAGVIANSGEIWAGKKFKDFPTENKEYLTYKKLFTDAVYDNLQDEVNSNIFFKSKDIDSIEKDSEWFRWTTSLEQSNIDNLNKNIELIYNKHKNFIKTYENGEYIYKPIKTIGKLKDINVIERGKAGNIMKLEVIGEESKILLITDSVIKEFFALDYIIDNNGKRINNIKKLPSSYFVFDKVYDSNGYLQKLVFYGGGNGHGVGLSLYAANKLAEQGKTYEEIISFFYPGLNFSQ